MAVEFPVKKSLLNRLDKRLGKGLGFSAVQLGEPVQVFVMAKPHKQYICNPKIILRLFVRKNAETCLSVGKDFYQVKRPNFILASYFTPEGKQKLKVFANVSAHIFDHECDHLKGTLISDKGVRGYAVKTKWGRKFMSYGGN